MRIPHGLRAAAGNQGVVLPNIGDAFQGGFYVGLISHTANGVPTHALIVAPKATGETYLAWQSISSATGASSPFDGAVNTPLIPNSPAADFCTGLSIGGYSDWYLPTRNELEIAYYNLKATTYSNDLAYGINQYSVPKREVNYTASNPAPTSIAAFTETGAETFAINNYWSSNQSTEVSAFLVRFSNGRQQSVSRGTSLYVRAFRKLAL